MRNRLGKDPESVSFNLVILVICILLLFIFNPYQKVCKTIENGAFN